MKVRGSGGALSGLRKPGVDLEKFAWGNMKFWWGGRGHGVNDSLRLNAAVHICYSTITAKFYLFKFLKCISPIRPN